MNETLKFSIAMPTRNNRYKLRRYVSSIRDQQNVSWLWVAVVVVTVVLALIGEIKGTALKGVLIDGKLHGVALT